MVGPASFRGFVKSRGYGQKTKKDDGEAENLDLQTLVGMS